MCLPMSGLGLAGKALDRKPAALLSPAAAIMGLGKTKKKSQGSTTPPIYTTPGTVGPSPSAGGGY